MTQTIGTIRVKTSSTPVANATVGAVKVATNPGNAQRVQSIQYLPARSDFTIAGAGDLLLLNTENNISVMTYDDTIQKFVIQNVVRINGGTF